MFRKLPRHVIITAILFMVFSIPTKIIAQEQISLPREKATYDSDSAIVLGSGIDNPQKSLAGWLILLLSLMTVVSLAIILSPKKTLIDEIKIIEEQ
jgi:hypothetical protein